MLFAILKEEGILPSHTKKHLSSFPLLKDNLILRVEYVPDIIGCHVLLVALVQQTRISIQQVRIDSHSHESPQLLELLPLRNQRLRHNGSLLNGYLLQ